MTTGQPVKSIPTTSEEEARLRKEVAQTKDRVRYRALEIHCERLGREADREDIEQAERETVLCHLAGIEDNNDDFRIIAAIPDSEARHLTVRALRDAVVVEEEPVGERRPGRCSMFPLHSAIDPAAVKAEFTNGDLVILAPKAARHSGINQPGIRS